MSIPAGSPLPSPSQRLCDMPIRSLSLYRGRRRRPGRRSALRPRSAHRLRFGRAGAAALLQAACSAPSAVPGAGTTPDRPRSSPGDRQQRWSERGSFVLQPHPAKDAPHVQRRAHLASKTIERFLALCLPWIERPREGPACGSCGQQSRTDDGNQSSSKIPCR